MSDVAAIAGVTLTPLREIADARGAVLQMLRADAPEFERFGECYFSEVMPGAIKAWKRHQRQTQNIAVPVGRVRFVIYDTREGSSTFDQVIAMDLGRPDRYARLRIPPQVWYGFMGIGERTSLVVNCADIPHDPAESEACSLDDPMHRRGLDALRQGVS